MTIRHRYFCNVCGRECAVPFAGPADIHGITVAPRYAAFEIADPASVAIHICFGCLSKLQAMPAHCGHGYPCNGGPDCGSDHK